MMQNARKWWDEDEKLFIRNAAKAWAAWVFVLGVWLLVFQQHPLGVNAACASGLSGATCRAACTRACFGHDDCNIDTCGSPQCFCNGHGVIDIDTGLCRCDATWAGLSCEYALSSTDCLQSQGNAIFLVPILYQNCTAPATTPVCVNGSTPYVSPNDMGVFADAVTTCNKPLITGMSLKTSVSSAFLILQRGNRSELIGVPEATAVRTEAFRFAFERVYLNSNVYKIQSAFDRTRTLEVVVTNGIKSVQLSTRFLAQPSLWKTVNPLQILDETSSFESVSYPGSYLTLTGARVLDLGASPVQWVLNEDKVVQYKRPGVSIANYTWLVNPTFQVRAPFTLIDPLACLFHCQRESTCGTAVWGFQTCYLAKNTHPPFTVNGDDPTVGTYRMYKINPTVMAPDANCLVTSVNLAPCAKRTIGPVNLQDTLASTAEPTLAADLQTLSLSFTARQGTGAAGSRYWMFENMDVGNEYVIYQQYSKDLYVLGVDSNFQPALVERDLLSPPTWYLEQDPVEATATTVPRMASFTMRLASMPDRVFGAAMISGILTPVTRVSAQVSQLTLRYFRATHYDTDPVIRSSFQFSVISTDKRTPTPNLVQCVSFCVQDILCRAAMWNSISRVCTLKTTFTDLVMPLNTALTNSYVHTVISADEAIFHGTATNNCANGARATGSDGTETYGTPFAAKWNTRPCVPPQFGPFTLRSNTYANFEIRNVNGQYSAQTEIANPNTAGVIMVYAGQPFATVQFEYSYDSQRFVMRATGDAPGVYIIHSAINPELTLEIDSTETPASSYDRERNIAFLNILPSRPTRWKLVGFATATLGYHLIEAYDRPGYVLAPSQVAYSTSEILVTASLVSVEVWSFRIFATAGTTVATTTDSYVRGQTYYITIPSDRISPNPATPFTSPDLYTCIGHTMRFKERDTFEYVPSTKQCRIFSTVGSAFASVVAPNIDTISGASGLSVAATRLVFAQRVDGQKVCFPRISGGTTEESPCYDTTCALQNYLASQSNGCATQIYIHRVRFLSTGGALHGNRTLSLLKKGLNAYQICLTGTTEGYIQHDTPSCLYYDTTTGVLSMQAKSFGTTTFTIPDNAGLNTRFQSNNINFQIKLDAAVTAGASLYLRLFNPGPNTLTAIVAPLIPGDLSFLWTLVYSREYAASTNTRVDTLVSDPNYSYWGYYPPDPNGISFPRTQPANPASTVRPRNIQQVETLFTSNELECRGRALSDLRVMAYTIEFEATNFPVCRLYYQMDLAAFAITPNQNAFLATGGTNVYYLASQTLTGTISVYNKTPLNKPLSSAQIYAAFMGNYATETQSGVYNQPADGATRYTLTAFLGSDSIAMTAGAANTLIAVPTAQCSTVFPGLPTFPRISNSANRWSLVYPNMREDDDVANNADTHSGRWRFEYEDAVTVTRLTSGFQYVPGGNMANTPRGVFALMNSNYLLGYQVGGCALAPNVIFDYSPTYYTTTTRTVLFNAIMVDAATDTFVLQVSKQKWQRPRFVYPNDPEFAVSNYFLCLISAFDFADNTPLYLPQFTQVANPTLEGMPPECFWRFT